MSQYAEDIPNLDPSRSSTVYDEADSAEKLAVKSPKFDPSKLQPSDFFFGRTLGEGAYARVVHAKFKKNNHEFAIKIMEKRHIKKENKVCAFDLKQM